MGFSLVVFALLAVGIFLFPFPYAFLHRFLMMNVTNGDYTQATLWMAGISGACLLGGVALIMDDRR